MLPRYVLLLWLLLFLLFCKTTTGTRYTLSSGPNSLGFCSGGSVWTGHFTIHRMKWRFLPWSDGAFHCGIVGMNGGRSVGDALENSVNHVRLAVYPYSNNGFFSANWITLTVANGFALDALNIDQFGWPSTYMMPYLIRNRPNCSTVLPWGADVSKCDCLGGGQEVSFEISCNNGYYGLGSASSFSFSACTAACPPECAARCDPVTGHCLHSPAVDCSSSIVIVPHQLFYVNGVQRIMLYKDVQPALILAEPLLKLIRILSELAHKHNVKVLIVSGFRTDTGNSKSGGVKKSRHLTFSALDFNLYGSDGQFFNKKSISHCYYYPVDLTCISTGISMMLADLKSLMPEGATFWYAANHLGSPDINHIQLTNAAMNADRGDLLSNAVCTNLCDTQELNSAAFRSFSTCKEKSEAFMRARVLVSSGMSQGRNFREESDSNNVTFSELEITIRTISNLMADALQNATQYVELSDVHLNGVAESVIVSFVTPVFREEFLSGVILNFTRHFALAGVTYIELSSSLNFDQPSLDNNSAATAGNVSLGALVSNSPYIIAIDNMKLNGTLLNSTESLKISAREMNDSFFIHYLVAFVENESSQLYHPTRTKTHGSPTVSYSHSVSATMFLNSSVNHPEPPPTKVDSTAPLPTIYSPDSTKVDSTAPLPTIYSPEPPVGINFPPNSSSPPLYSPVNLLLCLALFMSFAPAF